MVGGDAGFEKITFDGADDPRIKELERSHGHGLPSHREHWTVVEGAYEGHGELLDSLPTSMAFGGANGGEYRLSYHGYAPGYAQVIQSPRQFQITPMQVSLPLSFFLSLSLSTSLPDLYRNHHLPLD